MGTTATETTGSTALTGGGSDGADGGDGAEDTDTTADGGSGEGGSDDAGGKKADGAGDKDKASDGKNADGDKGKADDKAADEEIELKLPDALKDDATFAEFKKLAKESGLKSEQAQKIADLYLGAQKKAVEAQEAELAKLHKSWDEQVKKDPEIGGANFKQASELAFRAIKQFAPPELIPFLETTKLGNHPLLVKTFHAIGKAMAEDSIGGRMGGGAAPSKDPQAQLQKRYPSMFPKES